MTARKPSPNFTELGPMVLDAMRSGASMTSAANLAGITAPAVHRWIQEGRAEPDGRYGEFAREVLRIRGEQIREAELEHREARRGNANALQWYLARMAPEVYGDTAAVAQPEAPEMPDATDDDVAQALGRT